MKDESEQIRKGSHAIDEKLAEMEERNSAAPEDCPFGFAPTAAAYPFGLVAREPINLNVFGAEFGGARKRRVVH